MALIVVPIARHEITAPRQIVDIQYVRCPVGQLLRNIHQQCQIDRPPVAVKLSQQIVKR
jgi:hypothetical protein